jgi:hypothetical protein
LEQDGADQAYSFNDKGASQVHRVLQGCVGFKELRGNNGNVFLTAG